MYHTGDFVEVREPGRYDKAAWIEGRVLEVTENAALIAWNGRQVWVEHTDPGVRRSERIRYLRG